MTTPPAIACNEYPWSTFLRREGRDLDQELETVLGTLATLGFAGYEPLVRDAAHAIELGRLTAKHGLAMHSVYVNSVLHEPSEVDASIAHVLRIADALQPLGTRIVVTNPSPLRWGSHADKRDDQLIVQAAALNRLGEELDARGLILAYHNHDSELRHAARELHHMLRATNPAYVAFCLDAHWIYRGAGDSQVALFDVVEMYATRVVEVHLRQSQAGIWTESFGDGDIDNVRLAASLLRHGIQRHLVLEQAVEPVSTHHLDSVEAHRRGLTYAQAIWGTQYP